MKCGDCEQGTECYFIFDSGRKYIRCGIDKNLRPPENEVCICAPKPEPANEWRDSLCGQCGWYSPKDGGPYTQGQGCRLPGGIAGMNKDDPACPAFASRTGGDE